MPKIIENLKMRLVEEARRQVLHDGYSAMTIRSVAKECGVGVGTVYNYFPSKDDLVAAFMLEDWRVCIAAIDVAGRNAQSPLPVFRRIYDQLRGYMNRHQALFQDDAAALSFSGSFSRYHSLLRSQLAAPLRRFCSSDFDSEFIAEALLTWTVAGRGFEEIHGVIQKLF